MKTKLICSIAGIALLLAMLPIVESVLAAQCGRTDQVRLGPIPLDGSAQGVRFNYVNSSNKIASVYARFYSDDNTMLDDGLFSVEPGKGLSISYDNDGQGIDKDSVYVLADVDYMDPVLGFVEPIIAFEVPVFLTSLETYDDQGITGIWGTNGTAIWGSNGTAITKATDQKNEMSQATTRAAIAFPPVTVAQGEKVQLAVTNASDTAAGRVYLRLVNMETGENAGPYTDTCERVTICKIDCPVVCEQPVPPGGELHVEYTNPNSAPVTVLAIAEKFEVPVFLKGFEVPVFMPTMNVRSASGHVKFFRGAANQLASSSCQ